MAHINGIGGIFFKSPDPKKLAAWYRDVLGVKIESWGGAMLSYSAPDHPPVLVWNAFPADTKHFAPSSRDFMINFAVDDIDAFVAMLKSKHIEILKRDDDSEVRVRHPAITEHNGVFALFYSSENSDDLNRSVLPPAATSWNGRGIRIGQCCSISVRAG